MPNSGCMLSVQWAMEIDSCGPEWAADVPKTIRFWKRTKWLRMFPKRYGFAISAKEPRFPIWYSTDGKWRNISGLGSRITIVPLLCRTSVARHRPCLAAEWGWNDGGMGREEFPNCYTFRAKEVPFLLPNCLKLLGCEHNMRLQW